MSKKLNVYRQAPAIPTGEKFTSIYELTGRSTSGEWCRANLVKVGDADTFAEAKKLTAAPILAIKETA